MLSLRDDCALVPGDCQHPPSPPPPRLALAPPPKPRPAVDNRFRPGAQSRRRSQWLTGSRAVNKIAGVLAVSLAVVLVIGMATLLPEVTVGHHPPQREACTQDDNDCRIVPSLPGRPSFGIREVREPITVPIPWLGVSALAVGIGAWRMGWFIHWLERHDTRD